MSIRDKFNIDFFLNIKILFKLENAIPTFEVIDLTQISAIMDSAEISAIILDIDQTIAPFGKTDIPDEVRRFLQHIQAEVRLCLLSNVPRTKERIERIRIIEEQVGIKAVFADKRKPSPVAFRSALAFLESEPSQTLMVGDRLFTDIIGANSLGILTVMVPPLNPKTDPFLMVKLPRFFERYHLKWARWIKKSLR
jgi:HAD superfamily phosphatase (TIGR01668 family)